MANNRNAYQQTYNVSIPKEALLDIACNRKLKKKDYQVLLVLFTELDGWSPGKRYTKDPLNFKKLDISMISNTLRFDKKQVKKSLAVLLDEYIIEDGYSDTVKNGYRFTF